MPTDATAAPPPRIAVLVPCHNEAVAIGGVVAGFRHALPQARVFVYDNNSSDMTREAACAAGARVGREALQGKGHVVRRMFADIEADIYVLVDGDGTYDPGAAPAMIRLLREEQLDMVTGLRVTREAAAYRPGHQLGNRLLTGLAGLIFGRRVSDMLSGYRVFSRRFVKSFPALATGFETETEFTVHALELRMPVGEVATAYASRPPGSTSKLRTLRDGMRILSTILGLLQRERPLPFFGTLGGLLLLVSLGFFLPVLSTYLESGLVPRLPTFVASVAFLLLSFLSLAVGLVLETVTRGRQETKRIAYLAIPAPPPLEAAAAEDTAPEMGPVLKT
ncbi:glycosyl transferase [Pseudoroseomonas rhizosphaerae]|uniref:Glycosyl transferase n=1 Tax=Teichococcus rhizosphaerae TaxID=1335062 RepID=A0A2C7AG66_9PROT|nr:glycosyltransferase [Pseudoroseomonas rhizosphaerae]PHK96673.1 glycosyl transferase [Pseudoroseomonas rhizosphaerae]